MFDADAACSCAEKMLLPRLEHALDVFVRVDVVVARHATYSPTHVAVALQAEVAALDARQLGYDPDASPTQLHRALWQLVTTEHPVALASENGSVDGAMHWAAAVAASATRHMTATRILG